MATGDTRLLEAAEDSIFREYDPLTKGLGDAENEAPGELDTVEKEDRHVLLDEALARFEDVKRELASEEMRIISEIKELTTEQSRTGFGDDFKFSYANQMNRILKHYTSLYLTKKRIEFKLDALRRGILFGEDDIGRGSAGERLSEETFISVNFQLPHLGHRKDEESMHELLSSFIMRRDCKLSLISGYFSPTDAIFGIFKHKTEGGQSSPLYSRRHTKKNAK